MCHKLWIAARSSLLTSGFDIRSVRSNGYGDTDLDDENDESAYEEYYEQKSRPSKREASNYENSCIEKYIEDGDESCLCNLMQGDLDYKPLTLKLSFRQANHTAC